MKIRQMFLVFMMMLLVVGVSGCGNSNVGSTTKETIEASSSAQKQAPSFKATTIEGRTVSLESSMKKGEPLVVYFSASWCPICAKNRPVLENVYPDYRDKLDLVMISIDPTDTKKVLKDLAEKEGLSFPIVPGSPQIMRDFNVTSQATTVGVTPEGTILFMKEKTALSEEEYRSLFDQLIS